MDETTSLSHPSHTHTESPSASRLNSPSDISDEEAYSSTNSNVSPAASGPKMNRNKSPRALRKRNARPGDELFLGNEGRRKRGRKATYDQDVEMAEPGGEDGAGDSSRRSTSLTRDGSDQEDRKSTSSSATAAGSTAAATSVEMPTRGPQANTLLEFFVSDAMTLPKILIQPPPEMDFNIVIDDEGHTALHWAAAMAKIDVIQLLIEHGVDTFQVNLDGQTALMRSVLFSNNFDQKSFPALLEMLQKTIFTIDKDEQTVFHHIVNTAGQRGKIHAARYYLECLLEKLMPHPSELASIINVQDHVGDTALTIAARLTVGGKKVVKLLVDSGADMRIQNRQGKNAEDYMLEQQSAAAEAMNAPSSSSTAMVKNGGQHPQVPGGGLPRRSSRSQPQGLHSSTHPEHVGQGRDPALGRNPFQSNVGAGKVIPTGPHHRNVGAPVPPQTLYQSLQSANSLRPGTHGSNTNGLSNGSSAAAATTSALSNQRMIPTVSDLFGRLTHSYEKDLFEKDQDLQEAQSLLREIQIEIQTGHRMIYELKGQTAGLEQVQEQIRHLEGLIHQEIEGRQRLRLQELVDQEEERLKAGMAPLVANGGTSPSNPPSQQQQQRQEKQHQEEKQPNDQSMNGGSASETKDPDAMDVDPTPTAAPPSSSPTSSSPLGSGHTPSDMEAEAAQLRAQLIPLQGRRKELVGQLVEAKSQHGRRQHEYQRLIALCCNVAMDQVDALLVPLLGSLGQDDAMDAEEAVEEAEKEKNNKGEAVVAAEAATTKEEEPTNDAGLVLNDRQTS